MIRYALKCANGDAFEAWFRNSGDFDAQAAQGALECPMCGTAAVAKDVMAPAVRRARGDDGDPRQKLAELAARVRAHIRDTHEYVGERFAGEVRAIAEGEAEERPLWGEASPDEAKALLDEGLPVAPLPPALAPDLPRKLN